MDTSKQVSGSMIPWVQKTVIITSDGYPFRVSPCRANYNPDCLASKKLTMSISYGELGYIGGLSNKELLNMYWETEDPKQKVYRGQDLEDMQNAILLEMETREMPHP